jgi:hypothetical protein
MRLSTVLLVGLVLASLAGAIGFVFHRQTAKLRLLEKNERHACDALQCIADAERAFRESDFDGNGVNDFWTADVSGLLRQMDHFPSIARADAAPVQPEPDRASPYFGYWFIAVQGTQDEPSIFLQDTDGSGGRIHHPTRFAFCAFPSEYGITGRFTYVLTEHDIFFCLDTGGRPILRLPKEIEDRLSLLPR